MPIIVEQDRDEAKRSLIELTYRELIDRGVLSRPSGKAPDHAPARMLSAAEAGRQVRAYTEAQLQQWKQAHEQHLDQGADFLGCAYCDGRLPWDNGVPWLIIDVSALDQVYTENSPIFPKSVSVPILPKSVPIVEAKRPVNKKPSHFKLTPKGPRLKERFIEPLREAVEARVIHPTDEYGFIPTDDLLRKDYGPPDTPVWRAVSMSTGGGAKRALYIVFIPSVMKDFGRWLLLMVYPRFFTAKVLDHPADAHKYVKYASDILKRAEPKLLLYGLTLPTPDVLEAILAKIPQ